jgi:glycosyltransferase involved in cell wall biosynthesis
LAMWQRRLAAQADAFVVPSRFALERLHALGAPVVDADVIAPVVREFASQSHASDGRGALVSGRLAPEKGVDVAIDACRLAGVQLTVAGEGPERRRLEAAGESSVTFVGQLAQRDLARLRERSAVAVMPSRSAETFGLAAAEAMAAGVPVVASRVGALPELVPEQWLVAPGDPRAMADAIETVRGDCGAGERAIARARQVCAPEVVAPALAAVYG